MTFDLGDRLRELLNAYWLRPETALWRACDIRAMAEFEFQAPSLDLGCGDGVFSFIRAGGSLAPNFDVFRSIGALDQYFANADVYDSFVPGFAAEKLRGADYRIDVGLDHKANLLRKAEALGLYGETVEADANRSLPFGDASFNSLFSNVLYWMDDPAKTLKEVRRVLRPGGRACLLLPNTTLRDFSFYWQFHVRTGNPAFKFLELLDRGRLADNIKQIKSADDWRAMFANAGLEVLGHTQYLSRTIVQIWDVGLRPLFPVLYKMASKIPHRELPEIKREWIGTLERFLLPLAQSDPQLDQSAQPAFHCFIAGR